MGEIKWHTSRKGDDYVVVEIQWQEPILWHLCCMLSRNIVFKKRSYVVGLIKWHSSKKEALLSRDRSRAAIDGWEFCRMIYRKLQIYNQENSTLTWLIQNGKINLNKITNPLQQPNGQMQRQPFWISIHRHPRIELSITKSIKSSSHSSAYSRNRLFRFS